MKKRIAAEWEPARGVMVAWPASLPKALVCKLAAATRLHLLVVLVHGNLPFGDFGSFF